MENQTQQYVPNPQIALPNATAVLVLGIIGIIGCFCYGIIGLVCSIIALVLSSKDLKLYAQNPSAYTAASLSNLRSGRICAIIGLSISIVYFLFILFILITVGFAALSDPQNFFNHFNH
jgi:hypothetical protein